MGVGTDLKPEKTMSQQRSLADRAVRVLADVQALENLVTLDHAHRHDIWRMKHLAERILSDAFIQAYEVTATAIRLHERIERERVEKGGGAA